jgi:septum formation protein
MDMKKVFSTPPGISLKVLLGSSSPRRREILQMTGIPFEVCRIQCDETFPDYLKGEEIALYLSEKKSMAYKDEIPENTCLVTADTIVWCDEELLGKPENERHAMEMLRKLSGRMHTVFTGVTVRNEAKKITFFERSHVFFRALSDEEIEYYVKHFCPMDKAGAYGVQEWAGAVGIEKIEGCYYNVMGLPASRLYQELKGF